MKTRFIFCAAALAFSFQAWSFDGKWKLSFPGKPRPKVDTENSHNYTAAAGAYYFLPLGSLNAQLRSYGFTTGFTNAIGVGIDRGGEATSDQFKFPFVTYLAFHYLLPQEISAHNDSLKMKLNGYNFQFDFLAFNYLNSETMSFTAGIAWAFGRLKATENSPAGTTTFLDKYFGPQLRTEFNVCLGEHFYIGARASYRYDLTKTSWSRSGVASVDDLPATQLSGAMVGVFIGYGK
jgi:hypothetical protein